MSVQLCEIRGEHEEETVELMAPDYDAAYVWLWDYSASNRIDLSREQARKLRDALNEIVGC